MEINELIKYWKKKKEKVDDRLDFIDKWYGVVLINVSEMDVKNTRKEADAINTTLEILERIKENAN
ncbi:MAG: hypothetical protein IJU60_04820 [Acholeplasmatales bacterium]|nr:hypothetical protein [Acholeplasmatales bacterium]